MAVVMDRVVMVMKVVFHGKRRTRKDHQEQDRGKNLFHGSNVARARRAR
jgi:hypothetical protein